jgi:AbiV family abortive infection protein
LAQLFTNMKDITAKKAALGIQLAINNAESYIKASEVLINNKHYRKGYLLLLYALEEEGRVVLIWNSPFHTETDKTWRKWLKRFRNHNEKFWFSKDLDNFAAGKLAFKSNKKIGARFTEKRLNIAYVEFHEDKFISPKSIGKLDVNKLFIMAQKRLKYLKQNHPSVVSDTKNINSAIKELKGLTMQQMKKLFKERKKGRVV